MDAENAESSEIYIILFFFPLSTLPTLWLMPVPLSTAKSRFIGFGGFIALGEFVVFVGEVEIRKFAEKDSCLFVVGACGFFFIGEETEMILLAFICDTGEEFATCSIP